MTHVLARVPGTNCAWRIAFAAIVAASLNLLNLGCEKTSQCASDDSLFVYADGELCEHFGMGVNSSEGRTDWLHDRRGFMRMDYPPNQTWGAVFLTFGGNPHGPPRLGIDLSSYHWLSVDLRGDAGGEQVSIGIKDSSNPDDGSETRVMIDSLSDNWKTQTFSLDQFTTADLRDLYVVIEFVFDGPRTQAIEFRNIVYSR